MGDLVRLTEKALVDYNGKQLDLIRRTVAKATNQDEFDLFMEVSRRVGLDPLRKQIHAVVYNGADASKRTMSIITGIDGFRAVAARNGNYRADEDEPEIVYDEAVKDPDTNPLGIVKATVRVWKMDATGQWHPVKGWAYWDEYAPVREIWEFDKTLNRRRPTGRFELLNDFWRSKPRIMLPKCAEAVALRKGWPEDLSGIHAPEEMHQADVIDITATEQADAYKEEVRMRAIGGTDTIPTVWNPADGIVAVKIGEFADAVMGFLGKAEYSVHIERWIEQNRHSLNTFYAKQPNDCLELKREMEQRIADLKKKEMDNVVSE